jgi:shikimate kinase
MLVFLIGYMGSGKSTIAKKLANKLNLNWVDLDAEIERQHQLSIEAIFETKGEDYFRLLEHQTLMQLIPRNNLVIACGGGTPCFYDGINLMNQTGITVYLQMSAEALYSRLSVVKLNRPLLKNKTDEDLRSFIKKQIELREPHYSKAKIIVSALNLSPTDLQKKILSFSQNI